MSNTKLDGSQWLALIEEQVRSGMTMKAFAAANGITLSTLGYWKYKRARRREQSSAAQLMPVRVVDDASVAPRVAPIELVLRGGLLVRVPAGFDESTLLRVLRVAESSC